MLIRYEPWNSVRRFRDEMNRSFRAVRSVADDGSGAGVADWIPAVDIVEEDGRFVVRADVPGVEPESIEVTLENGVLTIRGERELEAEASRGNGYRRLERRHGTLVRRFSLPDSLDAEQVSAKSRNGVLEIAIAKKATLQPKRVPVAA